MIAYAKQIITNVPRPTWRVLFGLSVLFTLFWSGRSGMVETKLILQALFGIATAAAFLFFCYSHSRTREHFLYTILITLSLALLFKKGAFPLFEFAPLAILIFSVCFFPKNGRLRYSLENCSFFLLLLWGDYRLLDTPWCEWVLYVCGLLTLFTLLQAMVHRKEEGVGKFLLPAAFLISDLVLLWLHSGAIQNPLGKAALTGAAVLILFSQASAESTRQRELANGAYLMCIPPILYIIGGATDWPRFVNELTFFILILWLVLVFWVVTLEDEKEQKDLLPLLSAIFSALASPSYGPDVWVKEWLAAFSLTIGAVFLFEKVGYRKDTLPETSRTWEPWFCFFAVLSFGVALSFFHASPALGVGTESEAFHDAINPAAGRIPSPLEQFSILPLIPMKIGNLYFSFTNPSLFMLLTLSLVLLLLHFVTKKGGGNSVPNVWQSLVELIYDFVLNLVNEQIGGLSGNVKQKFFPCILVTFTFLLFRNLQGMIPYSFTVTSHFLITLGLSFSIFIGITIVGFQRNGLHFLSFSLPAGVPLPLAPFLVLLELIPHCFRALSSGIRLFANMMAGHSSVKILSGFAWTMLCMNDLLYFIGDLGPLFIVLALTGLELGVAILQAHVFTILICIYLNDATNLHQNSFFFLLEFL